MTDDKVVKEWVLGDHELHLVLEEQERLCTPIQAWGIARTEKQQLIPAIVLKEPIKNKEKYLGDIDVDSYWQVANHRLDGIIGVFLNLEYKGAGSFKFYIKVYGVAEVDYWFDLFCQSNGYLALIDGCEPTLGVLGVTLDIPKLITNRAVLVKIKKGKK